MAEDPLPTPMRAALPAALDGPLQNLRQNPVFARFGWPVAATALANALFRATGKRVRALPLASAFAA